MATPLSAPCCPASMPSICLKRVLALLSRTKQLTHTLGFLISLPKSAGLSEDTSACSADFTGRRHRYQLDVPHAILQPRNASASAFPCMEPYLGRKPRRRGTTQHCTKRKAVLCRLCSECRILVSSKSNAGDSVRVYLSLWHD